MREWFGEQLAQFRILYRIFWLRVIDLEVLSPEGDAERLLGHIAVLLAGISILFTFPVILIGGPMQKPDLWTFEHLFIATTLTVVGVLAVLSWDSSLPDRRDLLVLGSLPIHPRTIFFAKFSALAGVLAFAVVALNCFTGVMWPLYFSPAGTGLVGVLRSVGAFWVTMAAVALFIFCCVLCLQGAAALMLPRQLFLRISSLLQFCAFVVLFGGYLFEPSLESVAALTDSGNQRLLRELPSYWFLGLFQQLNGSMDPPFAPLARQGWIALAFAVVFAIALLLLFWVLRLKHVVEQPDILRARSSGWSWEPGSGSVDSAVVQFSVRSLLRSRQHRLFYSFYLSIGFAISLLYTAIPKTEIQMATGSGQVPVPYLVATLMMMSFAIFGLRLVIGIPVALRANWTFQLNQVHGPGAYMAAVRRTMLALSVLPVWVLIAVVMLWRFPLWPTVFHLIALGLFGLIVTDVGLLAARKLPFVCSYAPGKARLHLIFWSGVLLGVPIANECGVLEAKLLATRIGSAFIVVMLTLCAAAARNLARRRWQRAGSIVFQEDEPADLIGLNLGS